MNAPYLQRHVLGLVVPAVISCALLSAQLPADDQPGLLPRIQAHMRASEFEQAAALADQAVAAKDAAADEALLLKATALFQRKRFADAVTTADRLLADFPTSAWRHKAVFLKAQALIEQKQFAQAAVVYAAESTRILAPERKQTLVNELLQFAQKLETPADPNIPDAPPPNFAKAYSLYTKALAMELPRAFRDDILLRRARAIQQAGNPGQAIQDLQAYLTEYDPLWVGPAGSGTERLPMQNPPPAGNHVAMARFRLAEAFYQSGNLAAARMELEDLLKLISASKPASAGLTKELTTPEGQTLAAEIRWLEVNTYVVRGTPVSPLPAVANQTANPVMVVTTSDPVSTLDPNMMDAAIQSCRKYLAAHPAGSRAIRAAWMIAEALRAAGRTDDAIAAYQDFIAGKGFRLPAGDAANTVDEEIHATPATYLAGLTMRASFHVGELLAAQKKHSEAIAVWQAYIKDYPNGPDWPACQNAIIDSEYQLGLDALTSKQEELAMQRFNAFLHEHPLDPRAPRILYLFGARHEAQALELEETKGPADEITSQYRQALDEWNKVISKYPASTEARAAMTRSGSVLEEKLGQFDRALKTYQKLASEHRDTAATTAINRLTQKALALSVERVFRSNEPAKVRVQLRNIEKCEVRLYKIDLQAYFRKMHDITGVEALDVSLIQPDRSWTFKPDGYAKYKPLTQDVEIPFAGDGAGAYVVSVADDDYESTVLVLRSDLEVIVKASRRELLAFVQDMRSGQPAAGVDLLVSTGTAIAATGKTGADGVFKTSLEELKELGDVRVFALRAGHAAAFNLPLAGLQLSTGLTAKGYLYTDRPAYQPGATVAIRGVLREVRNEAYAIPEDSHFKISYADPQGRLLGEQAVQLSKFGTFNTTLALPASAALGRYTMTASQGHKGKPPLHFQGTFEVREIKLEKVRLNMDFARRVWFRGETITATLKAEYAWGPPLSNRILRCILPDRRIERVTTDAEGQATLTFDTTGMSPGSQLAFTAALDSDNITLTESVTLARLGFSINARASQPTVIAGEPFDLYLTTTGADGKPTGEALQVSVLRTEAAKPSKILSVLPWAQPAPPPAASVKQFDQAVQTDKASGKVTLALKLDRSGIYQIRTTGSDRFGQPITHETLVEVSGDDDSNKLRLFAQNATLQVGQDAQVRLHSRLDKGLALLTYEGENILRYQIVQLHKDYNEIAFKIGHDLFPNFRLAAAAIDGRVLQTTSKEFIVERELKVAIKPAMEFYLPGQDGQFELIATDQTGQPVAAELSLALVNQALYAVTPDRTVPIRDFFQQDAHRHAEFHTAASCGFRYTGSTRPVPKAVTREQTRLVRSEAEKHALEAVRDQMRLNFSNAPAALNGSLSVIQPQIAQGGGQGLPQQSVDLDREAGAKPAMPAKNGEADGQGEGQPRREVRGEGRWLPAVTTGADGKALVTLPMPTTITAWQITVRGCTAETLVGQASATTLTRKDFFVELKTPSFLREGDELRVAGRIHNLSKFAGAVPLTLRMLDPKQPDHPLATRETTVTIAAGSATEVTFDAVTVPNNLTLRFELTATAGDQRDALVQDLPVEPWGLPYVAHAGGTANADTAAVLQLPAGRTYRSSWLTVAVGPDVKTSVLEMALSSTQPVSERARSLPPVWGGHPADELLATASALAYANSGEAGEGDARQLAAQTRTLIATLIASQGNDGSWSDQLAGGYTTARAFWALIAARNAGCAVHKDTLDKAAAFLLKQLESFNANDNDSKAIVLHALSCDQRADFAACNRLYRERNSLGTASLAYLTHTFANTGHKEIAAELATLLENKAKAPEGQPVTWESGYQLARLNDGPETTALVLLALATSKPGSVRAEAAAQSLLQAHGCFGFPTARAKGPAVAALAAWFGPAQQHATDMTIDVQVNGQSVGVVKAKGRQGRVLLEVPAAALAADKNLVEFKMHGRGRYTYAATLTGFSPDTTGTGDTVHPGMDRWEYFHTPLEYRGRPIAASSSSPVRNLEDGQRVNVRLSDHHGYSTGEHLFVLDIPLPAGARLVQGSITVGDNLRPDVYPRSIRVYFTTNHAPSVSYDLAGYVPGKFRLLPPVIHEVGNPGFLAVGPTSELTVLAPGEKSQDAYVMNIAERYALGQCHFNDGEDAKALEYLAVVFKQNRRYEESNLARMLLWIYTKPEFYDAHKIVEVFEILRERFPSLEIPFDKILVCGRAYQDLGEHERAWLVYRAVISASFTNDSGISAVLEDEGRFLGSIDFQQRVWQEYPDTAEVVAAYFATSQLLYQKAPKAEELPKEDQVQPTKTILLQRTIAILTQFLALYPSDPLADDAGFSLCNGMLDLKDYARVVALSRELAGRHAQSELAPSFQYMTALGLFWQKQYDPALAAARVVADGESKDRDFARYILGQIYHAQSKPAEAIEWYGKVRQLYPDAADAISYFENKSIGMDEVTVVKPGAPVSFTLKYRNIKDAFVQVYRVDLMKLYLQQKNLSAITRVQLAGIQPESEQTVSLGQGKDYVEKTKAIALALKTEAAYLVICRGDDLFTSGMVLITPLKIEVQEDRASGRLRANVLDTVHGGYRPEVHVKAIGSADQEFRTGETDLRGLFIADNLRGKATVIAREGDSRYAFFRGDNWLGAPENTPAPTVQPQSGKPNTVDYQNNLIEKNGTIQSLNNDRFNKQRRQGFQKGVKIEKAQ